MAYFVGSVAALGGNATWTSPVRFRDRHDTVAGTVFSDQAGTLNVEQSPDGTHWDFDETVTVTASTGASFSKTLVAPYWRLRYVNGSAAQGTFRIQATTQAGGDS